MTPTLGRMRPRLLGLIARQHGLVLGRQATAHDVTPRQVARLVTDGSWVRVRRGVYADGEVWAAADRHRGRPLLRVRAAHLVLELDHWFSHDSAAVLHGIGLLPPAGELVHVTRPRVIGDRTKAGIKHHGARFAEQPGGGRRGAAVPRPGAHGGRRRAGARVHQRRGGLRRGPAPRRTPLRARGRRRGDVELAARALRARGRGDGRPVARPTRSSRPAGCWCSSSGSVGRSSTPA